MINIFKNEFEIKLANKYLLLFLLFFSGLFGFFVGAGLHPSWESSVEVGQVIAGIVKYPTNSIPQYMCLIKTWTILNQISAILLRIGFSEAMTSLIITGIIGAVSFQAVAIIFFSVSRNILLSLTIPFFIYFTSYTGYGVTYPIFFMESPHSYGRFGLAFILLIIGLFNSGYLKTASFLLGMAPCVHPSLGTYCILLIIITSLFYYKDLKWNIKKGVKYFSYGLFITMLSFMFQYSFIKDLPSLNYLEKKAYIASFIKYWDTHRIPFNYLSRGFFIGIFGSIISFIVIRFHKKLDTIESLFIFRLFIVSFFLSTALSLVTYLSPNILTTLHILMPGRYINLNNIMFIPLLLGILATKNNSITDKLIFSLFILGALSLQIFLPQTTLSIFNTTGDIQSIAKFIFMILMSSLFIISIIYQNILLRFIKNNKITFYLYRASFSALLLLSLFILFCSFKFNMDEFKITDPVLNVASTRKGMLLLCSEDPFLIQVPIRRPTLIDPGALDAFLYAPEAGPYLNNVLEKVYGLNIFIPPSEEFRNGGTIPDVYKKLWEDRERENWSKIRKEFGVTDILTLSDWHLSLPIAVRSDNYILYTIPDSLR